MDGYVVFLKLNCQLTVWEWNWNWSIDSFEFKGNTVPCDDSVLPPHYCIQTTVKPSFTWASTQGRLTRLHHLHIQPDAVILGTSKIININTNAVTGGNWQYSEGGHLGNSDCCWKGKRNIKIKWVNTQTSNYIWEMLGCRDSNCESRICISCQKPSPEPLPCISNCLLKSSLPTWHHRCNKSKLNLLSFPTHTPTLTSIPNLT